MEEPEFNYPKVEDLFQIRLAPDALKTKQFHYINVYVNSVPEIKLWKCEHTTDCPICKLVKPTKWKRFKQIINRIFNKNKGIIKKC